MLLPRQGAYFADKLADALIPFAVATGDKQASRYSQ